jgi:hypothetical protein
LDTTRNNARRVPRLHINTEQILAHVAAARNAECRDCDANAAALAGDIAALLAEISWLYRSLITARLKAANLEAAIRAAVGAREDGDYDPIGYLRDEITPDHGGAYGP